jgi:hypothetical protein
VAQAAKLAGQQARLRDTVEGLQAEQLALASAKDLVRFSWPAVVRAVTVPRPLGLDVDTLSRCRVDLMRLRVVPPARQLLLLRICRCQRRRVCGCRCGTTMATRAQAGESVRQLTMQVRFLQDELERGQQAADSAARRSADQLAAVKVCGAPT